MYSEENQVQNLKEVTSKFDLSILKEDLHTIFYKYAFQSEGATNQARNSCFDSYMEIRELLNVLSEITV